MKRRIAAILLVGLMTLSGCQTPGGAGTKKAVSIATAAMGGGYYSLGIGISEILKSNIDNLDVTVEVTGGTVENPGLVNSGECDLGIANTDMAYFAPIGEEPFETANSNLAGWFGGAAGGVVHYCVLESSGITTIDDLVGRTIAVGPQGNSTSLFLRKVLEAAGHSWDDITPSYMSFSEGMQALSDGKVDMAIASAYPPVSAVQELAASGKAYRILEFDDEFRAAFLELYPYYSEFVIPANSYDGQPDAVKTLSTENMTIVNKDLDEELVYQMTKAVFENLDTLKASATSAATMTLEGAPATGIELHPGAARYYREMGVLE